MAAIMHVVAAEGVLATEADVGEAELRTRFASALEREDSADWILESSTGTIVGHAGLDATRAAGVFSFGICILAAHRRGGGGRLLTEAGLEWARGRGAHKVELEVFPENVAAISLYEAMGFEREGLRRDRYRRLDGSLRSALIMARPLVRS